MKGALPLESKLKSKNRIFAYFPIYIYGLIGLFFTVIIGYIIRQEAIQWGATNEEIARHLPGDEIIISPMVKTTHAILINAPVRDIWPWLLQLGHKRAGWYTDKGWWSRLVKIYYQLIKNQHDDKSENDQEVTSANRILPEFQSLKVSDTILDGPPGTAFFIVRSIEPQKTLVLYSDTHLRYLAPKWIRDNPKFGIQGELTSSYILEEVGENKTRLILRMRANYGPLLFRVITLPVVYIWGELITARLKLNGIKKRSEKLHYQK